MQIETISIDKLTPYENNAKEHPEWQIKQIKDSIKEFGFNDPIAVWGENNIIIEGHGRYLAARELDIKEIPTIRLDGLTDEQRRAYTLVHNKITMNTTFDLSALEKELDKIVSIDMENYGFLSMDTINESIDDFFQDEEQPKGTVNIEQENVKFIITPDRYKEELIQWLELEGYDYEEK